MLRFIFPALVISACTSSPPPLSAEDGFVPEGYELVWSDEFDGAAVDPAKWAYDTHANSHGWYNEELQYYDDGTGGNATVANGVLRIEVRRESTEDRADSGGQIYTSARLITEGLAEFRHGFVTARAKMPCGAGTWPAIWTMGEGVGWPAGGEIDILEHVGAEPGNVQTHLHMPATVDKRIAPVGTKRSPLPTACTQFHDYAALWTPDTVRTFVDGREHLRYDRPRSSDAADWPFDRAQFLLLNVAIGGVMGGEVDYAIFPRAMEVDHVRVYQVGG